MSFPLRQASTILGKPRTGLHPSTVYSGKNIDVVNGITHSISDRDTEKYNYLIWELSVKYIGLVGFFDGNTSELWIWTDCDRRWWKLDDKDFRIDANNIDASVKRDGYVRPSFPNNNREYRLQGNRLDAPIYSGVQTGRVVGLRWTSYDAMRGSWIVKSELCDEPAGNPPIDDCVKYGINCPKPLPTGKIYTRIDSSDILNQRSEINTYGIWSDGIGNLTTFHTCSQAASSQSYQRAVYNKSCGSCGSEVQFDVAYGHDGGSGSIDFGGYDYLTPTNATYGQYRGLALGRDDKRFKIANSELDDIYVINIRRNRMIDRVDEGNIELNLAHLSGSEFVAGGGDANAHTGSNVTISGNGQVLRLIDDSRINFDTLSAAALTGSYIDQADVKAHRAEHGGQVYFMVSGSIEKGIYNETNPHVYGMVYPHLGIIVLDADRLDASASFGTVRGTEVEGDNSYKLFAAISGAAQYTDQSGDVLGFQARRKETQWAEYFFIRVKNSDYNFTNNPTFQTGSEGLIVDNFIEEPKVYFSTVGLYNEQKELLAVGKVSRAIQKTCTSEALFKLRLKY